MQGCLCELDVGLFHQLIKSLPLAGSNCKENQRRGGNVKGAIEYKAQFDK